MSSPKSHRLCFLLGAGASAEAGVPTAGQMISLILQQAKQPKIIEQVLNREPKYGSFDSKALKNRINSVHNLLHLVCQCHKSACSNIEELYRYLRLLNQFWNNGILEPRIPPHCFNAYANRDVIKFVDFMVHSFLCPCDLKVKEQKVQWDSANYLTGIRKLFEPLKRRLDVFTINYDISLEVALDSLGIQWSDGFILGGGGDVAWFSPEFLHSQDYEVAIYKLHGSHRWRSSSDHGFYALPMNVYVETTRAFLEGQKYRKKLEFYIWKTSPYGYTTAFSYKGEIEASSLELALLSSHLDLSPMMIWADENKARWSQPYRTLHELFSERVCNNGMLVVIGYSWGDEYLNERIREMIMNDELYALLIVGPSDPPMGKILTENIKICRDWHLGEARISPRIIYWFKAKTASALRGEQATVWNLERKFSHKFDKYELGFYKYKSGVTLLETLSELLALVEEFMDEDEKYKMSKRSK